MPDLMTIKDREIFSAGTWNGSPITEKDLDDMVEAFNATKKGVPPYLKLGHDEEQKFLQKEGLPAAGWIDNVRRVGSKLVADYVDLPQKIYELIQKKAYRKVSSEVFHNIKIHGKTYRRMLKGVALLGAETPGVMDLNDILSMYGIKDFKTADSEAENKDEFKTETINFEFKEDRMPTNDKELFEAQRDLKDEKKRNDELQKELEKYKVKEQELDAKDKKIAEQEDELKKFKAEAEESAKKAKQAEVEKFTVELEKENLCTPAMKPYVVALLGDQVEKYSIEKKEYSKPELLKEVLKLHKSSDVNFDKSSDEGDHGEKSLDAEVSKYMKENKDVSYRDAYIAVASKKEELTKD